jgi:hypothetical protein
LDRLGIAPPLQAPAGMTSRPLRVGSSLATPRHDQTTLQQDPDLSPALCRSRQEHPRGAPGLEARCRDCGGLGRRTG